MLKLRKLLVDSKLISFYKSCYLKKYKNEKLIVIKIFQMSLKYLTIMETLKTLSVDEVEKISVSTSGRAKKASKWFFSQVNELTQISLYGRDWEIRLPKAHDEFIYVCWTKNYYANINKENKAHLLMKFNDTNIKIVCKIYQICDSCNTNYSCDKCKFLEDIPIVSATLKDDNILIEQALNTWEGMNEWTSTVLQLYKPLFLNYKKLYDGYLHF